jgi:hypothetical protein
MLHTRWGVDLRILQKNHRIGYELRKAGDFMHYSMLKQGAGSWNKKLRLLFLHTRSNFLHQLSEVLLPVKFGLPKSPRHMLGCLDLPFSGVIPEGGNAPVGFSSTCKADTGTVNNAIPFSDGDYGWGDLSQTDLLNTGRMINTQRVDQRLPVPDQHPHL